MKISSSEPFISLIDCNTANIKVIQIHYLPWCSCVSRSSLSGPSQSCRPPVWREPSRLGRQGCFRQTPLLAINTAMIKQLVLAFKRHASFLHHTIRIPAIGELQNFGPKIGNFGPKNSPISSKFGLKIGPK